MAFEACQCEDPSREQAIRNEPQSVGFAAKLSRAVLGPQSADERRSLASRAQVILPSGFPLLFRRGLRSPRRIEPGGAVLFGHNPRFPLKWDRAKPEAPPEEGEPEEPTPDELADEMNDSGLGTSGDSLSPEAPPRTPEPETVLQATTSTSSTAATPNSLYGLGNPTFVREGPHRPCPPPTSRGPTSAEPASEASSSTSPLPPLRDRRKRDLGASVVGEPEPATKLRRVEGRITIREESSSTSRGY